MKTLPFHFTDTGNPQGPSVVFVHAFPMSEKMWDDQVSALKKDYRILTFDVRGFGRSELRHPYTLEFVVDDLISMIDHLKIEKTVLCGLSMGGYVALRAVQRNPNRFHALVLADTTSEPDSDSAKLGRYKAIQTIEEKGLATFVDEFIAKSLAPHADQKKSPAFARAHEIAMANNPAALEAGLLALISRTDTSADLGKIKIPTLILHGDQDSVIPLSAATALNQKIPGSKIFVITQAGHLSNLDNPQEFNAKLIEFLAALE